MRVRVLVFGKVQGVFFRESTRREAERLGLAGWVRNRADGCVEALFEGHTHAVNAMVQWCQHGPPAADVTGVERFDEAGPPETGFRVLR